MEKITNINFNDLCWHDAEIEKINIYNEGNLLKIKVIWCDNTKNDVFFEGVYWTSLDMNFGIIGKETILSAFSEDKENLFVKDIYSKWKGMIDNVDLNYYEIETNSTASKIRIVAINFYLL